MNLALNRETECLLETSSVDEYNKYDRAFKKQNKNRLGLILISKQ